MDVESATPAKKDRAVTLPLTGMTCAACARTIERTLQQVDGVSQASVNFATSRADVRFLRTKLIVSLALFVPTLIISMAGLSIRGAQFLQLVLTAPVVFFAGAEFYRRAWISLRHRNADMNTLIAIGTGAAFAYSVYTTLTSTAS